MFNVNVTNHACKHCNRRYIDYPNMFPMNHRVDGRQSVLKSKGPRLYKICYECLDKSENA